MKQKTTYFVIPKNWVLAKLSFYDLSSRFTEFFKLKGALICKSKCVYNKLFSLCDSPKEKSILSPRNDFKLIKIEHTLTIENIRVATEKTGDEVYYYKVSSDNYKVFNELYKRLKLNNDKGITIDSIKWSIEDSKSDDGIDYSDSTFIASISMVKSEVHEIETEYKNNISS